MITTPEERAELRLDVDRGLKSSIIADLLDDIDELIKSNAILSMWTCCAANVCAEAKNHEEARKAIETSMKDLNEEIRILKARAEKAEKEVERLRTALDNIVGMADCFNKPVVEIARKALEGETL